MVCVTHGSAFGDITHPSVMVAFSPTMVMLYAFKLVITPILTKTVTHDMGDKSRR